MPTQTSFSWWGLANLIFSGAGATIILAIAALTALVILIVCRDRLRGVSIGLGNYKLTFEEKPALPPPATGPAGASSDRPSAPAAIGESDAPEEKTDESKYQALMEMSDAVTERSRSGIEAAFSKLRANPPWEISAEELEAWEQSSLLRAGFSDALDNLIRTENQENRNPYASRQLARYYLRIRAFDEAVTHARNTLSRSQSNEDISIGHLLMAEIVREKEGRTASAQYLIEAAKNLKGKKEISRIYTEIGDTRKALEQKNLALASYEIALRADMRNETARFNAAYIASTEESSRLISLRHYQIYLETNAGNTIATNNLGVLYGELNLSISKVRQWRLAQKNDDGFATGNLAIALTDAGFADEAQKELDAASDSIKNHARMLYARGHLEEERDKDQQSRDDLVAKADKIWQCLRPWESDPQAANDEYFGDWRDEEGRTLTISKTDHNLALEIIDGDYKILSSPKTVAGVSTFAATREYKIKHNNSLLGALYGNSSGTMTTCTKPCMIRIIYADSGDVRSFEFTRSAS